MALYSVWDWNRNAYAVYSTPKRVSVGDDPVPPRPKGLSKLGASPDDDVKPLPSGAKLIGYDHFARGEIRRRSGLFGVGDDGGQGGGASSPLFMFLAGGATAAGAIYAYWRWKR